MLPFSKRPPPPEEYFLRSGDFEAVRPDRQDAYAQPIPSAPRAPVFARQAAQTPYGFSQSHQSQFSQYNDLSAPPPPHSLAPVAMGGPDSTARNFAHTASPHTNSVILREKPSLKWGVMIALTGALLGGVLGLGMDARRQSQRAAAAADARDNAPPAAVAAALPNAVAAPRPAAAPVAPPAPIAPTLAGNGVIAPAAPVVLAAAAPVVIAPAKSEPAPKAHAKAPAPRPHSFVAAKVVTPPKAEKAEKPEPAPAPEKTAKVEKAEKAEKAEKTSKKDANTSDAMKILEAANKDTTNTL
ncbi:MAG: hypothetical protein JWP87_2322 [Labilithrix sp.]|nr:hypothetical protein [Labilithrix sp.]